MPEPDIFSSLYHYSFARNSHHKLTYLKDSGEEFAGTKLSGLLVLGRNGGSTYRLPADYQLSEPHDYHDIAHQHFRRATDVYADGDGLQLYSCFHG